MSIITEDSVFLTPYLTNENDVIVVKDYRSIELYKRPDYKHEKQIKIFENDTVIEGYWFSNNVHIIVTDKNKLMMFNCDWSFIKTIQYKENLKLRDVYIEKIGSQQGWFGRNDTNSVYTVWNEVDENGLYSTIVFHNDICIYEFKHKIATFANIENGNLYVLTELGHLSTCELSYIKVLKIQMDTILINEPMRIETAYIKHGKIWLTYCDDYNNCIFFIYDINGKILNKRYIPKIASPEYTFNNETLIVTQTSKSNKQPIKNPKILKYIFDALNVLDTYDDTVTVYIPFKDEVYIFEKETAYYHSPHSKGDLTVFIEDITENISVVHIKESNKNEGNSEMNEYTVVE